MAGRRELARALAIAQILLGALVIAGWLLYVPALTQVLPGRIAMVIDTALCFGLHGTAVLLALSARPRVSTGASALALLQLLIAVANLAQIAFGVRLGVNLSSLHRWIDDVNPHPGQMALASALSFALAAGAMLLQPLRERRWVRAVTAGTIVTITVIALLSLVGQLLELDLLLRLPQPSYMAVHTALGLLMVAYTLQVLCCDGRPEPSRERRIATLGTVALIGVPLIAGVVGISGLKADSEDALGRSLGIAQRARADALVLMLEQYASRAEILTTRPNLMLALRREVVDAGDTAAQRTAQTLAESYLQHGFRSIRFLALDGRTLVDVGSPTPPPALAVNLQLAALPQASLLWRDGLVLRVREPISDADGTFAEVISEQPLVDRRGLLFSADAIGPSASLLLCGTGTAASAGGVVCFPITPGSSAFGPAPGKAHGQPDLPIALAIQGQSGLSRFHTSRRASAIAAYGPVDATGLALALRVETADFYGPIGRGLVSGLLLVALVTAIGALMLRGTIRVLMRRLAYAEQRDRKILESLHEGVMLQDGSGRVLASNPAATRIIDAEPESLDDDTLARHGLHAYHEDGSPWPSSDHPAMRTLRSGRAETGLIMGLRRRDGLLRWLSVNTAMIHGSGEDGAPAVVISFDDITARREADARARMFDQRFRLLVDGVTDYGIVMLGVGGYIVSWNPGAERMQGYSANEILGRHFSAFYPRSAVRLGQPAAHLETVDRLGRFEEEGWRIRKDGTRFWASVLITAVSDDDGKLIGYSHIARDLSARRQTEQALAQSYKFQAAILESAPFSIIATDPSGLIRSMNPAAEHMLGYRASELVGAAALDALHDPDELAEHTATVAAELGVMIGAGVDGLLAKARYLGTEEREWLLRRKDGTRVPVSQSVTVLRDDSEVITGFLAIAHDITERKRREEIVQHVAHHDFLTGLPNRALLHDRLTVALDLARREQQSLAVLMLDLDHFKHVNDTLGHPAGDQLLVATAKRIQGCVRANDTVARLGGDEFVVLLGQMDDTDGVERVARAIIEAVSAPVQLGEQTLTVTPSIGISRYPEDGADVDTLLRKADSAMYLAKTGGRCGYRLFNEDLERAARMRRELEGALRRALEHEEFALVYQPQICLATGALVGLEALLRWEDPECGQVLPSRFMPVADENGLIVPIGAWSLAQACREAVRFRARTGLAPKLCVNLSLRQLREGDFVALLEAVLAESGLPGEALEFEIAESALVAQLDQVRERLQHIRALGVSIAMDNVGAGLASLSGVTHFPIDTLKIDRSFVRRLPDSQSDAAIAQAIIALARNAGIRVVAEGVETLEQLAFLHARASSPPDGGAGLVPGAFGVQGFLLCRPLPAQQLGDDVDGALAAGRAHLASLGH